MKGRAASLVWGFVRNFAIIPGCPSDCPNKGARPTAEAAIGEAGDQGRFSGVCFSSWT